MENQTIPCKALVLAGGGARGSYQVGVWRALMELDWHPQIITGTMLMPHQQISPNIAKRIAINDFLIFFFLFFSTYS